MTPAMFGRRLLSPHLVLATAAVALAACGKEEPPAKPLAAIEPERTVPMETLARGARLYVENCAQCHGPEGQGHPDWQTPGVVAAPPLNGTGNDWKRKKSELVAAIKTGFKRKNEEIMPGWGGRISDAEIEDLITYFQALWPADVYERWQKANASAARPKG